MPPKMPAEEDLAQYERPSVAVDVVVFRIISGKLCVLLIRRRGTPYQGKWAIPGGFVQIDESLDDAARRELQEETGVQNVRVEQLHSFGDPDRDPRGRVISVTYFALLPPTPVAVRASDDAEAAEWFALDALPALAFDHGKILEASIQRLRFEVQYRIGAYRLLPREFTLSELQAVYEIVLGTALDKRNFRRRMLQTGGLVGTGEMRGGEGRPARLYTHDPSGETAKHPVN